VRDLVPLAAETEHRAILEASTPAKAQPVPDEHEVLVLLSEAARGGNVTAMRELLKITASIASRRPSTLPRT
jgi:hypothetical protein